MTQTVDQASRELTDREAEPIFASWVTGLAAAVQSGSETALAELFTEEASWRDFMAFLWDFHHTVGRDETVPRFLELAKTWQAADFAVSQEQAPVVTDGAINAFVDFTTKDRHNRGYVMLVADGEGYRAQILQTQVIGLQDHPELVRDRRREGKVYGVVPGRTRWTDDREKEASFADADPTVLVLGAGHNGLSIAARLGALDVSTLVIDKEARVGDQWRKRYASLALHSTVFGDHLPYMPLPPNWPAHTPKDKFADWLESYAKLMDINIWHSTTFLSGHYDDETQRWTIQIRREDGTIQELHPRHFVVAGGMFGAPKIPPIKGLEDFEGIWSHSDEFQNGGDFAGKKTLVIGAGVSGHELAHDLFEHGADVTLLQRSATYVVTYESYHRFWSTLFTEYMPYTPDFADQMTYCLPNQRVDELNKRLVKEAAEADRPLLDQLEAQGFKLEWGPDGTGIIGAHMSGRDAYQINIGASELIADGRVHLKQGVEVAEIQGKRVIYTDGTTLDDVELIVFATGYHQFWGHLQPVLGKAAEKIDKAYGRAADGEYANTWRRSAQPGLWFGTGFIRMARFYSRFMALLIKAIEEGVEPVDPEKPTAG
ncbi:NAD(P)/FAD-dependent oxidoreductase [Frankia sp. AgB1.9]|uniref:flavin-containing monooxygenase n=1 Tax=unclassified Frankia TaxID=2632575 RepID=UPI001931A7B8|nr:MULTISPECIES: NAD(P)/FAD-dependent oxidoreductase [unclassified Frankia]MBL7490016.1 NAD(P)/FAD-dependent oxidoreductase [Frankia sp. AgW1.1]MBL7547412.1 NAD(P)/FAD-dependent oxidoreductase [Frankia sp. AgB1.9]MBL7624598.1 NAD(P)/FAD-dependent oxidoreductase [Frankia sp. AgB1.8]